MLIGQRLYTLEILKHQVTVMDEELGDVIDLGAGVSERAKVNSGVTLSPETEGFILGAIEQCLMHRYLGYCNSGSCEDYGYMSELIDEASA